VSGGVRKSANSVLVTALAAGAKIADAATRAGVSERTVFRRLQDPDFQAQVQAARAAMVSEAVGILSRSSADAALKMAQLLEAEREPVQLGAARSILDLMLKLRAEEDIEARLAALEQDRSQAASRNGRKVFQ
jgi:hypothetical protein